MEVVPLASAAGYVFLALLIFLAGVGLGELLGYQRGYKASNLQSAINWEREQRLAAEERSLGAPDENPPT